MLELQSKLTLDRETWKAANLCDKFDDDELQRIGDECAEGYERDEKSREDWMRRNEAGMDLALQVQKDKNFPWPGCANVAFPLVTIAALQFHARAYPALVPGRNIVKCETFGPDPQQLKAEKARLQGDHMSWQLLYEDRDWEPQEDASELNLSIVGTNFKKTYFDPLKGHFESEFVHAKDLVVNYWATSFEYAPRKTHKIPYWKNEIYSRVRRKTWRDCLEEAWYAHPEQLKTTPASQGRDDRQGVRQPQPDQSTTVLFCEQHTFLDLDQDGYAEPYIVTFEEKSHFVVRIVCNFSSMEDIEYTEKQEIVSIKPTDFFTKRDFIPSPDGGMYGVGFGVFLGPLNESVNSLSNMLLDAGTLQTTAGGFLGRGAKIRGGVVSVTPFTWKTVDATGDDLRKSIVPHPVNAPSDVLFKMLVLLIEWASRISGTTDIQVGENPGQNTPAETTRTMVEMGQKIYTAIFKRVWRSMKEELRKIYLLNGVFGSKGLGLFGLTQEDYLDNEDWVQPVADPTVTSETQRIQTAGAIAQRASTVPGYDKDAVELNFLRALHVEKPELLYGGLQKFPPGKPEKVQVAEAQAQARVAENKEKIQAQIQGDQARGQLEFKFKEDEARLHAQVEILQHTLREKELKLDALSRDHDRNMQMRVDEARLALEDQREHSRIELEAAVEREQGELDSETKIILAEIAAAAQIEAARISASKRAQGGKK